MPLLVRREGKKAEGAVRGEKDEFWVVAFDIMRRPADLDSGSDLFQEKVQLKFAPLYFH